MKTEEAIAKAREIFRAYGVAFSVEQIAVNEGQGYFFNNSLWNVVIGTGLEKDQGRGICEGDALMVAIQKAIEGLPGKIGEMEGERMILEAKIESFQFLMRGLEDFLKLLENDPLEPSEKEDQGEGPSEG